MYLGVASPVVEMFVRGGVPRDVRLLAARGLATSDGRDRLVLLALLTGDGDHDVAALAADTIAALPPPMLAAYLEQPDVPPALRAWYLARAAADPAPGVPLAPRAGDDTEPGEPPVEDEEEERQLLSSLPVPDKVKIATLGRREQRAILIRDPNRIVAAAVLSSPKLTDTEVENFARMQNVSDEVLRIIGTSRAWTKNYPVVAALVKNPRTPPAVSLSLLTRLQERDVKSLTVDRNIPESVRLAARKHLAVQQSRRSS